MESVRAISSGAYGSMSHPGRAWSLTQQPCSRLGLETESRQDLFVLRNVVMSPFQAAGDFVQNLADEFQKVLEEETKVSSIRHIVSNGLLKRAYISTSSRGTRCRL